MLEGLDAWTIGAGRGMDLVQQAENKEAPLGQRRIAIAECTDRRPPGREPLGCFRCLGPTRPE